MDAASSGLGQENAAPLVAGAECRASVIAVTGDKFGRPNSENSGHAQDLVRTGHDDLSGAAAAAHTASKGKGAFPVKTEIQTRG
jgi:hypothetical protein